MLRMWQASQDYTQGLQIGKGKKLSKWSSIMAIRKVIKKKKRSSSGSTSLGQGEQK